VFLFLIVMWLYVMGIHAIAQSTWADVKIFMYYVQVCVCVCVCVFEDVCMCVCEDVKGYLNLLLSLLFCCIFFLYIHTDGASVLR